MEFTVAQIAHILGGKVEGDASLKIRTLSKIQEGTQGSISFLSNPKYEQFVYNTGATAVIVSNEFIPKESLNTTLIRVNDPYTSFTALLEEYHKITTFKKHGIEQPAYIAETAQMGERCYVGAFAYIGAHVQIGQNVKIYPHVYIGDNVQIGDNTILYPGVKIYDHCVIGNHCTLQSGAVIGSDGFGFAPQADGSYKTIPQLGNVILEDHVDIGANTVIDCATMGSTIIHQGVKLDNLIQIAHNVEIGKNTVIAAQTGIAGSATIGENCVFGGHVGIVGHISVPNKTTVGAKSGLSKTVFEEGKSYLGWPSTERKQYLKSYTLFKKLPELQRRIEQLEEKILTLTALEN